MSSPFLAEIRMFCGNFAPRGYAQCDGQLLPISQSTALFSILGTTYGGDGRATFGLPNLQDSSPIGAGQGPGLSLYDLGEEGGSSTVTLSVGAMPAHTHVANGDAGAATLPDPSGAMLAQADTPTYAPSADTGQMSPGTISVVGGSQPHNNRQPYLGVMFIIALQGIFPARN
jgi:microcystin-dependent protein